MHSKQGRFVPEAGRIQTNAKNDLFKRVCERHFSHLFDFLSRSKISLFLDWGFKTLRRRIACPEFCVGAAGDTPLSLKCI